MRRLLLLSISVMLMAGCSKQDDYHPAPGAFKQAKAITLYEQGVNLTGRHKYDTAIERFTEVLQLDPNFIEAYIARGNSYTELRKHAEALADFNKALQLDPTMKKSREYLYLFRDMSVCHVALKQFNEAIEDSNIMIALDKKYQWAYMARSVAYDRLGKVAESERDSAEYERLQKEFEKTDK